MGQLRDRLRLFSTQLGILTAVNIDPLDVRDEPCYANFYALYKESTRKLNAHGHPYKDVVELVPISAATPDRQAGSGRRTGRGRLSMD